MAVAGAPEFHANAKLAKDPNYLRFLDCRELSPETLRNVVNANPFTIKFIHPRLRTHELNFLAISKNPHTLHFLTDAERTDEILDLFLDTEPRQNGLYFLTESERTPERVRRSLIAKRESFLHVLNEPKHHLFAMEFDGLLIQFLNDSQRTPLICATSVQQNRDSSQFLSPAQRKMPGVREMLK